MGIFLSNDGVKTFSTQKPKLPDQVRRVLRTRLYSKRTEEAYVNCIRKYIFYHNKRHPQEMGRNRDQPIFDASVGSGGEIKCYLRIVT
ncbi:MAG: hypothetical protein GXO75_00905, partial [Calditrichaeota bacterium]|nr:hypothetical protein [Calditrichota bacterium]